MRGVPGRHVALRGTEIYLEESGNGDDWVVFESGMGAGRAMWDLVTPLLRAGAHTVTYDRAGRGRSGRPPRPQDIDEMAATLVELVETVVSGRLVLVAHSMGGLVARRAAEKLSGRLTGLVLVDPTVETAPQYDDYGPAAKKIDGALRIQQPLSHLRWLVKLAARPYRHVFPRATFETMLAEDFAPAGITQMRHELAALAKGVSDFRRRPPEPPACQVVLISAARASKRRARDHAQTREHQRQYVESVGGRFEDADSEHMVPAEQPQQIAEAISVYLSRTR